MCDITCFVKQAISKAQRIPKVLQIMPRPFLRILQGKTKPKFILREFFLWKMNVLKMELQSKAAQDYIIIGGGG